MKKITLLLLLVFTTVAHAQIGVKAGLTFNNDEGIFKSVNTAYQQKGKNNVGYHIGVFKEFKLAGFFVEPEILYVTYKNKYLAETNEYFDVRYQRVDIPVSVGTTFAKLFKLQAGPVLSYYFKDNIDWKNVSDIKKDDFSIGLQLGAGVEFHKFHVDLRYDFPLSDRQTDFVKNQNLKFQTKNTPKLFHVSVGYEF